MYVPVTNLISSIVISHVYHSIVMMSSFEACDKISGHNLRSRKIKLIISNKIK